MNSGSNAEPTKKYALIIIVAASFIAPFMGSAINLAIPSIGSDFQSSAFALSWVVTSFFLGSAAFLLPFGKLADMIGRKKVFSTGLTFFLLFTFLCGIAWSINVLLVFRFFQGIASSMTFGTAMAILTSVYPPGERGKALGLTGATVYLGLSLGPVLGGAMNHYLGWQSIFFFTALLSLLILGLTWFRLPGDWSTGTRENYDWLGAALYTTGLIGFMFGLSSIARYNAARYIFLSGLVLLALFVWQERKAKNPIFAVSLLSRNTGFVFSNLSALINYSATFAVTFMLSLYLQVVLQIDSQLAGLILLAQPAIMAILSPFAGALSDRVEPRIVSSWGMAVTTLCLVGFSFLTASTPLWLLIANLALLGFGFALFASPNSNAVMSSVDRRSYGVASSTLATARQIGQTISMAIVTLIIAVYAGSVNLTPAYTRQILQSSRVTFIVFAIICFAGIFASLARGSIHNAKEGQRQGQPGQS